MQLEGDPVALSAPVADAARAAEALAELGREGLAVAGFSLGQPSLDEVFLALTGQAPAADEDVAVRQVIHMLTQHLGPEELLVGARVEFDPALSMAQLADAINACEARVRAAVPITTVIYLEPDIPGRSAPTLGP